MTMNENTHDNLRLIEVGDDVEGHGIVTTEAPDEDTEGHFIRMIDGPDEDDVEGHVQPPRGDDTDHLHS